MGETLIDVLELVAVFLSDIGIFNTVDFRHELGKGANAGAFVLRVETFVDDEGFVGVGVLGGGDDTVEATFEMAVNASWDEDVRLAGEAEGVLIREGIRGWLWSGLIRVWSPTLSSRLALLARACSAGLGQNGASRDMIASFVVKM